MQDVSLSDELKLMKYRNGAGFEKRDRHSTDVAKKNQHKNANV